MRRAAVQLRVARLDEPGGEEGCLRSDRIGHDEVEVARDPDDGSG